MTKRPAAIIKGALQALRLRRETQGADVNSRIRSCYITAPAGSNLEVLSGALRRRDIRVVTPYALDLGPTSDSDINKIIGEVDLVIGILTRERRSEWVLFELGQAWAMGRQILLLVPPGNARVPSTLRRFLTVRANLSNREAIEFALDQLLASPGSALSEKHTVAEKTPLGEAAGKYLEKSVELRGLELENLVAEGLRAGGVDVLSQAPGANRGVDFAVWSDALEPYVGNPLLVEVKSNIRDLRVAYNQLSRFSKTVSDAGSMWGLLLVGSPSPDFQYSKISLPPNVLVLSVREMFDRMKVDSFDKIVLDLRNRRVHGGPF